MPKRLLFVTTHNFATNPRLVKEVRTSVAMGHRVTVFSFAFQNWSKTLNDQFLTEFAEIAHLVVLEGDRRNKASWIASTLASLIARCILPFSPRNVYLLSFRSFKRSWLLWSALRNHRAYYDLIIAHNPGAFVPSFSYAIKRKIRLGVDMEDYHPGEGNEATTARNIEQVVKKVLSKANIITAASPLILEESLKLVLKPQRRSYVLLNVFSKQFQPAFKELQARPLKLIWFSQTVGLDRGIQDAIHAMNSIASFPVHLTLVGDCSDKVRSELLGLLQETRHSIVFLAPLEEQKLIEECSLHHIGLALEQSTPLNRDICLTNKIFSYLLAGNAILASQTSAQKQFIHDNPDIGKTYSLCDVQQMAEILVHYGTASEALLKARKCSYILAQVKYNWEKEAEKFVRAYELN